ncbi:hypothetical protein EMCG_00033 [[Emmonsia] crescens]|uniref:Uncharacterized protein n=1 Tax=[Emmonsia] crescens TaxID=73230 RepID=A0A0G2IDU7_9EURO|nr:hypothetical protein EMCG_00033 [Emmonsia crescens UAMH 3008]
MASHAAPERPENTAGGVGVKITWENGRGYAQIMNQDITAAIQQEAFRVSGRWNNTSGVYPVGVMYHDLSLVRENSDADSSLLAPIIQTVREALDKELNQLETDPNHGPQLLAGESDMAEYYWTEVMYRRFLGVYEIHCIGESIVPPGKGSKSFQTTLTQILSDGLWGFHLGFGPISTARIRHVEFRDIQHLHLHGVIFKRYYEEREKIIKRDKLHSIIRSVFTGEWFSQDEI